MAEIHELHPNRDQSPVVEPTIVSLMRQSAADAENVTVLRRKAKAPEDGTPEAQFLALLGDLIGAFCVVRGEMAAMSKSEIIALRGWATNLNTDAFDVDGWRGFMALIEIIGGEMQSRADFNSPKGVA